MRNIFRLVPCFCLCWVLVATRSLAQTVACPAAPNNFTASVTPAVTFDPTTNLYTYKYTVANASTSQQQISDFAVDFATPVSNVLSPTGWTNTLFADRNTIHWKATAAAALPPGVADVGQVPPGIDQIQPGTSLAGFSFQSSNPPGPVNDYALGFVDIAAADTEETAENSADNCPGAIGGFFDLAVLGTTQGPVLFIPVQIEIKPGDTPAAINPTSNGNIPVAILSSNSFNAPASVNPSTVRFGPASASPTDSGHVEDVNNDGLPDLVFQFPTLATGIVCGDTSETLTGNTLSGTSIQGSDSVVTVKCKK